MSVNPEAALVAAVIATAFDDAFALSGNVRERDEAQHFLLDRTGRWAQSRRAWLDLVGGDPSAFEAEARRRFARWQQDMQEQAARRAAHEAAREAVRQQEGGIA